MKPVRAIRQRAKPVENRDGPLPVIPLKGFQQSEPQLFPLFRLMIRHAENDIG